MLGSGNDADHFRSLCSRYGDRGRTNAAGCTRGGDPSTFEVADLLRPLERGDAAEAESGHVEWIDVRRERRGGSSSDGDVLGVAARPSRPHAAKPFHHGDNAIADANVRHGGTRVHDLANHFQARRVGKRVRCQDRPVARADLEIGMVDGRPDAANAYFIWLQRRSRNEFLTEHIRTPISPHDDRCALLLMSHALPLSERQPRTIK
jgi:hypothetical protein